MEPSQTRREKIAKAEREGDRALHFELLLIGPAIDASNLLRLLAEVRALHDWDLEVAQLDPEDSHLA